MTTGRAEPADGDSVVAVGGPGRPGRRSRPARRTQRSLPAPLRKNAALLGLLPFFAYTVVFLGLPTWSVVVGAFRTGDGHWTLANVSLATRGPYRTAFITSFKVSVLSAAIGTVAGTLFAQAVLTTKRRTLLYRVVTTASGVFANFGGVPLAFVFIATLGTTGLVTRVLNSAGLGLAGTGFSLFSFAGISVVYVYFQVPLMVLVITPALEGLRPQWREAAENLGASAFSYWRHVALPVLTPPLLGSFLLLFGSAFAAYSTAAALTSGAVPLVSIEIGSLLSGNVIAGGENMGKALGFGMIVVTAVVMVGYVLMARRASRWLR